ncbi:MAG: tetratricopeptide repeat protein [Bacteroidota bacterium]|nr:tetratricopeptide repeat protein [Bacteroidota bacterium]
MKKIYFLSAIIALTSSLTAQTADFKKAVDNGNQKYKAKSYKLAMVDYDAALKIVSADIDKLIAEKTPIPADKKYMLEPLEKRANCAYFTSNIAVMKSDIDKVYILDSSNANAKALKAYELYKAGKKSEGCIAMQAQVKNGSDVAPRAFTDCFCSNEGILLAKEATTANNMKKYDDALTKADAALKIIPDSAYVHSERGKALFGKGQDRAALKALDKAISLSQKNYKAYYSRAQIYMKLNKLDSAMIDMNSCLKLNPTLYEGYLMRADIAEQSEAWADVIFNLKNCIKMKPDDGKLYYRVAVILHEKNDDLHEACDYYRSASAKGVEEAKEMAMNCDNLKYMKTHGQNAKKDGK